MKTVLHPTYNSPTLAKIGSGAFGIDYKSPGGYGRKMVLALRFLVLAIAFVCPLAAAPKMPAPESKQAFGAKAKVIPAGPN